MLLQNQNKMPVCCCSSNGNFEYLLTLFLPWIASEKPSYIPHENGMFRLVHSVFANLLARWQSTIWHEQTISGGTHHIGRILAVSFSWGELISLIFAQSNSKTSFQMFLTDVLFNSARLRFSLPQKKAMLEWAKDLGAKNVPSLYALEQNENRLMKSLGCPTIEVRTRNGNLFYINDIAQGIAKVCSMCSGIFSNIFSGYSQPFASTIHAVLSRRWWRGDESTLAWCKMAQGHPRQVPYSNGNSSCKCSTFLCSGGLSMHRWDTVSSSPMVSKTR